MPKTVTAEEGSTLCQLAIAEGHLNCKATRAVEANKKYIGTFLRAGNVVEIPDIVQAQVSKGTDTTTTLTKENAPPVDVRFVRGEHDDKDFAADDALTKLNVSNYVSSKAGASGAAAFPTTWSFNADAHEDADAFRIEVTDPAAGASVNVKLEAVWPAASNTDGTVLYKPFSGVSEEARRKIDAVECKPLPGAPKALRSRYLRLVIDAKDHSAVAGQTLMVSDTVDDNDETLEVLDQKVRASYEVASCPCSPKCVAVAELPIGEERKHVKVAVHLLKDPGGTHAPVVTKDAARKFILKYVRRQFAQACVSPKLVCLGEVPAPANMFSIGETAAGAKAQGGKTISVKVKIDGTEKDVSLTTDASDLPIGTAAKLAEKINEAFGKTVAKASKNPPLAGKTDGSADVLIGDPATQTITLAIVKDEDANHKIAAIRLTSTEVPEFDGTNMWIGTPEERLLLKNYDTGTDRIDAIIVGELGSGSLGEGFIPGSAYPAAKRCIDALVNSTLVSKQVMSGTKYQATLAHECLHVMMDVGGHPKLDKEIFTQARNNAEASGSGDDTALNGRKRITAASVQYEDTKWRESVKELRSNNAGLFEDWA